MAERAPITERLAGFISGFRPADLDPAIFAYTERLVFDAVGTLAAATHPSVTVHRPITDFALAEGGPAEATLIGAAAKVGLVPAVLANGTLGYACDFEPHHPGAILHPIAVMLPAALALCEAKGRSGQDFIGAVALGTEVTYRVSMAMGPRQLYGRGFHPSAVCGAFGAAAAAAFLLRLDAAATKRALGLAALQASGLMAWEDDPSEQARPFQMGMAARNGVTAALLAEKGLGAPDRIFDGGHDVLRAFSDGPDPAPLTARLGGEWRGITEIAIKPYPCVAFLHPALDALADLITNHGISSADVTAVRLRFAAAGVHCIDANPLKSHCAQYVLAVRLARGRLRVADLFDDLRNHDREVARLAAAASVVPDQGAFDRLFPAVYAGEVTLTLRDGREFAGRSDIARGYPTNPLTDAELRAKFENLAGTVGSPDHVRVLAAAAVSVGEQECVSELAALLRRRPEIGPG